jgi:hypothetical protein
MRPCRTATFGRPPRYDEIMNSDRLASGACIAILTMVASELPVAAQSIQPQELALSLAEAARQARTQRKNGPKSSFA